MLKDEITKLKRKRYELLKSLYVKTKADPSHYIQDAELQTELGLNREEFLPVVMELNHKGFVDLLQQAIAITFPGIHEVERVESNPEHGTDYFPAINLMYVEQAWHSQIQQGTSESTQSMQFTTTDLQSLTEFITKLGDAIAKLNLGPDDENQAKAEIATVEAQASSTRPNRVILRESLGSLRRILEGAAGEVAATLLQELPKVLSRFTS
jgi:hypothetical protein